MLQGKQARQVAAWAIGVAVHYPTTTVVAVFLFLIFATAVITAGQMTLVPANHQLSIEPTSAESPILATVAPPNLRCIATRLTSISIRRGSGLDWQLATGFEDNPTSKALLAVFENSPLSVPVDNASEVKARIAYRFSNRDYVANPATWLGSRSPTRIAIGDQRELILAICNDHLAEGNRTEGFLIAMEDRRDHRSDSSYYYGPWMLGEVVATVSLTVNGIAEKPFLFRLLPRVPDDKTPASAEPIRTDSPERWLKKMVHLFWDRQRGNGPAEPR
jgi:hypothetical protein